MSSTEIIQAAMRLPTAQRADLAMQLLQSLDGAPEEEGAEQAWAEEVHARLSLAEGGHLEAHDWRESVEWLRAQLKNPTR